MTTYLIPELPRDCPTQPDALFRAIVDHHFLAASALLSTPTHSSAWLRTPCKFYRAFVKQPFVAFLEVDGEMKNNLHDVATSFCRELRFFHIVTAHENIVRFMGCIDSLGLVIELIDGETLVETLTHVQPTPHMKINWANAILDGILHIHSFGLSHGDISGSNVMINRDGIIKLVDFGRSALAGEQRFPGTAPFQAPEIWDDSADPFLCDTYSFGVLLLCLDMGCIFEEELPTDAERKALVQPLFLDLINLFIQEASLRSRLHISHRYITD